MRGNRSHRRHREARDQRARKRHPPHRQQFFDLELQPDAEQQQDDANLGQLLGQILVVSALGGLTYAVYTRLLGIPELGQALSLVRSSLRRGDRQTETELNEGPPGMAD